MPNKTYYIKAKLKNGEIDYFEEKARNCSQAIEKFKKGHDYEKIYGAGLASTLFLRRLKF